LFPLLYERRSEWVVTKAVGGRLPEHLKAVVMCCRPRRSRAIGVYGTTLSRFCVRGVSRGAGCPPPRFGDCSGSGWCEVAHVCADHRGLGGCSCPVWMPLLQFCGLCRLSMRPTFHSRSTQVVVAGVAMRADCPGAGGCPPPTTCFCAGERILVLWQGEKVSCCGLCRTGHICVFPGRLLVVESEDSGQVVGALWAVSVMVATQASWFRGVVIPFRVGCSS